MTSRERVLAAIRRQRVDRTPARFNGDPGDVGKRLARDLGIPLDGPWFERLHERFRIDLRIVDPEVTNGDYSGDRLNLADARTAADVDAHWPQKAVAANRTLLPAKARIAAWDAAGSAPAVQLRVGSIFTFFVRMRGDTLAYMDIADENPVFLRAMDRTEEYLAGIIEMAFDTLGDRLDIVYLADELGMQTGLFFSPATIRRHLFPRFGRLFERVHSRGAAVFYHSCGAIEPMIGELIDLGVDVLNPIQPGLPGMDPENLSRKYGRRVCFCGGLDMQHLLPQGTPGEVRREARRYMERLGPGYILDAANILHADIPTANVAAMYDAERDAAGS